MVAKKDQSLQMERFSSAELIRELPMTKLVILSKEGRFGHIQFSVRQT